jgi:hypothetical protein
MWQSAALTGLSLALAVMVFQSPGDRSSIAPSLPALTEAEEARLDQTINGFIQADLGKTSPEERVKATTEFRNLGAEAVPALIRGLNHAATLEASCPAVTIARKLSAILRTSNDPELLVFARENIGAGVTYSKHRGLLNDLRVLCTRRRAAIGDRPVEMQAGPAQPARLETLAPQESLAGISASLLLAEAARAEGGSRKTKLIEELAKRNDAQGIGEMTSLCRESDIKVRTMAREFLDRYLGCRSSTEIKEDFKSQQPEIRAAAARVTGRKGFDLKIELVDLLNDDDKEVRSAAHRALVRLTHGPDFGPKDSANEPERRTAAQQWRSWLSSQTGH